MMTREPGDLPVAVVLSCGRGVPDDRGISSRDDLVGVVRGEIALLRYRCRAALLC